MKISNLIDTEEDFMGGGGTTIEDDGRVHVLEEHVTVRDVIAEIAANPKQDEAFYVCDMGDIVLKYEQWLRAMPRVKPFYAVKCNDSHSVLALLAQLGTGFDCASKVEVNKVLSLGVHPERIIFANPAKPASHIRHAQAVGVDVMTFDNESELYKVQKLFPTARLVIRIRCEALFAQCPLGMKFGCHPTTEAPQLLQLARALDLNVVGISFHVGSGCGEPAVFGRAIAAARALTDYAAYELGYSFSLLDIGGGYPGDTGTSIDKIASIINDALDTHFPDPSEVAIIAEPGRYFVSSAYTLVCSVHSIRTVKTASTEAKVDGGVNAAVAPQQTTAHHMYYINDGVYGSFNCVLYDHQRVVATPLKNYSMGAKRFPSSVWGPTCDGLDRVIESQLLPHLEIGDWLLFENMGAYTIPVASPFNGFPVPRVQQVAHESIWQNMFSSLSETRHFADVPDKLAQSWPEVPLLLPLRLNPCSNNTNTITPIENEHVTEMELRQQRHGLLDYVEVGVTAH